jgi:hypothetical protein
MDKRFEIYVPYPVIEFFPLRRHLVQVPGKQRFGDRFFAREKLVKRTDGCAGFLRNRAHGGGPVTGLSKHLGRSSQELGYSALAPFLPRLLRLNI